MSLGTVLFDGVECEVRGLAWAGENPRIRVVKATKERCTISVRTDGPMEVRGPDGTLLLSCDKYSAVGETISTWNGTFTVVIPARWFDASLPLEWRYKEEKGRQMTFWEVGAFT